MLSAMRRPEAPELRLLLACARAHTTQDDEAAIRAQLAEGIDWTIFVQKAVAHGLAGLAGHTLARLAPDAVPEDLKAAFATFIEDIRKCNQTLLDELAQLIGLLAAGGVETIPFKGPVLAQQAFGDLGLRGFRDLDFLIRDRDLDKAVTILGGHGYDRKGGALTPTQLQWIHRLQGQEVLFKPGLVAVEPHTRLISLKMALNIDYDGLWQRARPSDIFGHRMLTFASEDTLLVLAIHGGKELWWDIKWACDIADFIAAHPGLDWKVIAARAHAQGCTRMLLVATALARHHLGAQIPDFLAKAEAEDRPVGEIADRILARWEMDDPGGPPSNKIVSWERLLLHDGPMRRASYVLRTLLLPGPQHIGLAKLPQGLGFFYIPLGLAHDLIALPIYRAWEKALRHADRLRTGLILSSLPLALLPISSRTRQEWKRLRQAHRHAVETIATYPAHYDAWTMLADAEVNLKLFPRAIASYDKALALLPDNAEAWKKRSHAAVKFHKASNRQGAPDEPRFDLEKADGWALRAGFLFSRDQFAEASEAAQQALRLAPGHEAATRIGILARHYACDWSRYQEDLLTATRSVASDIFAIRPVNLKQLCDSEDLSFSLARFFTKGMRPDRAPLWKGEQYRHEKIRIAYLSTDLRSHPVGSTIVAPLEHHNKKRFEVTAISIGLNDGSPVRRRIESAVDRFIDARAMSDFAVARLLRELEIDVAIDLNGLTGLFRTRIFAHRAAPLQVNYLGYPGTMAAPFMDYIIADKVVIPDENRAFYGEQIAHMPHAYLPCGRRTISHSTSSRAEQGLPEKGIIFTCFNSMHKLLPDLFAVWMRILHAVDGSVLWLPGQSSIVVANLRREALSQGVSPERLVFARFEKKAEDHIARQRLADLFLDTLPYNAHSTAADALWAGLPLLTCRGQAFQARVAASLLETLGLPELVTTSPAEYEKRAIALARDPQTLAAIREKLARNRDASPLFDTLRYTRDLEALYTRMWERQQAGQAPEGFSITADI
jgi:predicted O-linked N-acetylglucosamine transferase (SPINDLY family)